MGGWRISCSILYKKTGLYAKMLYDNNRKDISIRLTIIDSVINHQETAIIDIINNVTSYQKEGSIDKTNILFYQYHPYTLQMVPDYDLKRFNVIPVLSLVKSTIECYLNWKHSYLIKYTYKYVTIEQFMMTQIKAGTLWDIFVYTKTDDTFIQECEQNIVL
ncbi:hypothetical protein RF11_13050 [Thelohanellus kitauei]|uniref:Uncharacterized protein n=1 Tax=Thelohanellus kitauei TaxID=669202 RepID=A0A0C2IWV2_THEKT|nr:hypothetical protein RF11_13050 [Thelohanellus kitauei]